MFSTQNLCLPPNRAFPTDQVGAERCLERALELILDTVPPPTPKKSARRPSAAAEKPKKGTGVVCEKCGEVRVLEEF